jgi:hypothetical protein
MASARRSKKKAANGRADDAAWKQSAVLNAATALSKAAAVAAGARAGLRDRLCAGKPGKLGDYRVRLSATCVATAGAGKAAAAAATKAARERKAAKAGAVPSAAATRAEIRILEREIAVAYPDPKTRYDVMHESGDAMAWSHLVLAKMIDPRIRLLTPDPLLRYAKEAELVRKSADAAAKKSYFDVRDLQRHTIMRATLAHLRALV